MSTDFPSQRNDDPDRDSSLWRHHVCQYAVWRDNYIFFNNTFSRTDDWVNSPYEMLLKSYHTDELNSPVSCIYCWYLIYGRLELFSSPMCDLQIHLSVAILDYLLSYRFTVSPVSMAYGQLANSPHWRWYTVVISHGWVSKPYKRDRNNTTAIPDELVRHSKSIPMAKSS